MTCDQIHPTDAEPFQRIDLHDVRQQDSSISTWNEYVKRGNRPKKYYLSSDYDKIMHRTFQKLPIVQDLPVRVTTTDSREH